MIMKPRLVPQTILGFLLVALVCPEVAGLDLSRKISQFRNNMWRIQDGYLPVPRKPLPKQGMVIYGSGLTRTTLVAKMKKLGFSIAHLDGWIVCGLDLSARRKAVNPAQDPGPTSACHPRLLKHLRSHLRPVKLL
jgi:hypothetical protein